MFFKLENNLLNGIFLIYKMPRPRIPRKVSFHPEATYFKPVGVPLGELEQEVLTHDEVESIRLIDHDKIEQNEACKKMGISQATLSRLLSSARQKISQALVHGKAIKIYEGDIDLDFDKNKEVMKKKRGRGMNRGGRRYGRRINKRKKI